MVTISLNLDDETISQKGYFSGLILFLKRHSRMLIAMHFVQVFHISFTMVVATLHISNLRFGLGLAFWRGENRYKDVSYISASYGTELYTALNNEQQKNCSDGGCSGKLVHITEHIN